MEITLLECQRCGKQKIFWLRQRWEEGFYCTCSSRKLHSHYSGGYEDYFISLVRDPLTVDRLVELAEREYLSIDPVALKVKLEKYDLNHLSEADFYQVIKIVLSSDNLARFRNLLRQIADQEQILAIIANVNPRIDLPKLKTYLSRKELPLTTDEILALESAIENDFYHPEITDVSDWEELPSVRACFSPRLNQVQPPSG